MARLHPARETRITDRSAFAPVHLERAGTKRFTAVLAQATSGRIAAGPFPNPPSAGAVGSRLRPLGRLLSCEKLFPRGAPMQHLAPRRNPECSNGNFNTLDPLRDPPPSPQYFRGGIFGFFKSKGAVLCF